MVLVTVEVALPDTPRRPFPLADCNRWIAVLTLAGLALLIWVYGQRESEVSFQNLPTYGGVFREGVEGTPLYVNPVICSYNEIDRTLCRLLYRGLMRFNQHGEPVLDLAQSYEISPDGLTYTFTLQPDLRWHDGTQLTARDAQFTFEVLQDPDFPGDAALSTAARLARVEAVEADTLVFVLEQPFAPFLDLTTIGLLPRHIYNRIPVADLFVRTPALDIVGNGPFEVTHQDSDSIRLSPFLTRESRRPFISALELHFYPHVADLYSDFVRGEIEGLSTGIAQNLEVLPNREELQLFFSEESNLVMVLFNHRSATLPTLAEVQVREALVQGVNRAQVLADSPQGWGVVAHSPVPVNNWAHKPDMARIPFDPLRAVRLLDDSGWRDRDGNGVRERDGNPFQLVLHTSDDELLMAYGDAIASYWRDMGIDAEVVSLPFDMLVEEHLEPGDFHAAVVRISDLEGDPDPFRFWHSSQALNYGGWTNPFADQLMVQARITLDQEARRHLYHQFQDIFAADIPAMPLSYPVYAYGVHQRVKNVQMGLLNDSSERFASFADWAILSARVAAPASADTFPK